MHHILKQKRVSPSLELHRLTGLGGCFQEMVYTIPFPMHFGHYNINHLEMINVMVALKI